MARRLSVEMFWDKIGYEPHTGQAAFHDARFKQGKRFRVVDAGRRTGKSTAGGHELTLEAFRALYRVKDLSRNARRAEYWIVGPEYTDAEKEFRVVYNDLAMLGMPFDKPGTYNSPLDGNMHISLWDGRFQIHAKSAKYPTSLVGEALEGVILAEAAKLKPVIWTKHIRPMLADYGGWAVMSSTPEGKNWFHESWQRGIRNDPGWWGIKMPSWTNNIIFPGGRNDPEILALENELTSEMFSQEVGAEFTEFAGRVFKTFDEQVHVKPLMYSRNPGMRTYAACDYGFTNPFVWLLIQVDVWDNVYVIDEYYQAGLTISEHIENLRARNLVPLSLKEFYPDPGSPGDSREISEAFKIKPMKGTGGEIKDRINLIRRWLEPQPKHLPDGHPEKQPKLFIDNRRCPMTVSEMQDYRYPQNKSEAANDTENPMKRDDHTPEALGRFFAGKYAQQVRAGKTVVREAQFV